MVIKNFLGNYKDDGDNRRVSLIKIERFSIEIMTISFTNPPKFNENSKIEIEYNRDSSIENTTLKKKFPEEYQRVLSIINKHYEIV